MITSPATTTDHQARLKKLIELGIALTAERNLDRLFDRILREARGFTGAEAGTLYVVEKGDKLRFCIVQNDAVAPDAQPLRLPLASDLIDITRTSIAGYVASTGQALNLRDVYRLPDDVEYRFNDWFDRKTNYRTSSMLAVPLKNPAGAVTGVLQLINSRAAGGFDVETEELVLALASQAAVALENAQLTARLETAYQETIFRLARAAEFRDTDTGEHIQRVSHYAAEIAREIGFDDDAIHDLILAISMHDIGKIGLSDGILRKPAGLTPEERKEMEHHTTYGAEILSGSETPILAMSREIALSHHEKWDGTGYPRGLRGEAIPLPGRICALADVYDALTTKRCYKDAMPLEQACDIIRKGSGTHFDPAITDAFFRVLSRIVQVGEAYSR